MKPGSQPHVIDLCLSHQATSVVVVLPGEITSLENAREISQPASYEELVRITEVWVDAALRLESKDLRMMEQLVNRQTSKAGLSAAASPSNAFNA